MSGTKVNTIDLRKKSILSFTLRLLKKLFFTIKTKKKEPEQVNIITFKRFLKCKKNIYITILQKKKK